MRPSIAHTPEATHVKRKLAVLALTTLALVPAFSAAQEKVQFVLNWVPAGDHAPYFYAQKMGWYKEAGINLSIENGRGSGFAVQKVGAGQSQFGIADMPTALQGRGKGADVVGVMVIYANSPYGLYWKKSSGIKTYQDLKGKKLGNPPGDAARLMWPAIAAALKMKPEDVAWVNVAPEGKIAALQAGMIDATTHFYNFHYIYERQFGSDMGFLALKDVGFNPYGNSIIVNGAYMKAHPAVVGKFVKIGQKAMAFCIETPAPCLAALSEAASQKSEEVAENWKLSTVLMTTESNRTIALGYFEPKRMESDYAIVKQVFSDTKEFAVTDAYTNEFLDRNIKMKK